MRRQVGSTPQVQFNPIQKKSFGLRCEMDSIEFPSPHNGNPFLVVHLFPNHIKIQFNPIQEVELDSFFFFVKTCPKTIRVVV